MNLRLSDTLKKADKTRISDAKKPVVPPSDLGIRKKIEPNPNASPTFSKNFANKFNPAMQNPMYQPTTTQVPNPVAPIETMPDRDPLREHIAKFGKSQESQKPKFKGY